MKQLERKKEKKINQTSGRNPRQFNRWTNSNVKGYIFHPAKSETAQSGGFDVEEEKEGN
jgi:hypothetical protein